MSYALLKRAFAGKGVFQIIMKTSATNFLVMALATVTSVVTARMFGVTGKGELSAILFWATFLSGILSFGLPTSLIYNTKKHREYVPDYMRLCFLYQLPISILAGVIVWIFIPEWLNNYSESVVQTARWFTVLNMPLLLVINVQVALARTLDRFDVYNGLRLNVPLFNLIGLLTLWFFGALKLQTAATVYFITTVLVVLWSFYKLKETYRVSWLKKIKEKIIYSTLFGYGSRVFGTELLGTLYNQFDKLIILSMLTAKDMGLYTVMYTCSRLFNVVQSAITNVIFPKVTGLENSEVIQKVGRAFRISTAAMLVLLVPGMLIGQLLIGLLFGKDFLQANTTFYLLCIECVLGGSSWILTTSFNAIGRPGLVLVRQILALALTIGMFYWSIPLYGLNGVAFALLAGALLRMLFSLMSASVLFKVSFFKILFDKNDIYFIKQLLLKKKEVLKG